MQLRAGKILIEEGRDGKALVTLGNIERHTVVYDPIISEVGNIWGVRQQIIISGVRFEGVAVHMTVSSTLMRCGILF